MGKPALIIVSQQVLFRRALAYLFSSGTQYEVTAECGGPDELPSGEQVTGYCLFIVDAELPDSQIHQVADFARNRKLMVILPLICLSRSFRRYLKKLSGAVRLLRTVWFRNW